MVYAESSAALAWLLAEADGEVVRKHLDDADAVVTSRLTLGECERVLIRGVATSELTEPDADAARRLPEPAAARWAVTEVGPEVFDGIRRVFPKEPVRKLDAIHVATMLLLRPANPDLAILALDARVRDNAGLLGFELLPRL